MDMIANLANLIKLKTSMATANQLANNNKTEVVFKYGEKQYTRMQLEVLRDQMIDQLKSADSSSNMQQRRKLLQDADELYVKLGFQLVHREDLRIATIQCVEAWNEANPDRQFGWHRCNHRYHSSPSVMTEYAY